MPCRHQGNGAQSWQDVILLQLGNWLLVEQVCSVEIFCFRFTSPYLSYADNILYAGFCPFLYSAKKVCDLFCFIFHKWMFCCHWIRFSFALLEFGLDLHFIKSVRFEVLTAVLVKSEVLSGVMQCRANSWPMFWRIFVPSSSGSCSSRSLPYVSGTPFFVANTLCYSECRCSLSALRAAIVADCLGFLHFPKTHAGVGR